MISPIEKRIKVAPSLLAADPLRLGEELRSIELAGADMHHIDVMDGHFVPNLSYGPPLIRAIKAVATIPLDVHIMVANPDEVYSSYIEAGADILVFHPEATRHPYRLAQAIRARGVKSGVAINPGTPLECLWPLLEAIDVVTLMSVNPGFGGQSFIASAIDRVRVLHQHIARQRFSHEIAIEVDGGINEETGACVVAAGANVLVAGTYVYGAVSRETVIQKLQQLGK